MSDEESSLPRTFGVPKLRRAALERLARAYADDDLELEDYERRTGEIHAAETVQEIARVMADIPDFDGDAPRAGAHRSSIEVEEGEHGTAVQVLGDREIGLADFRGGAMHVFRLLGDTRIDLSDLAPHDTVVVTDFGVLGDVVVRVPAGTEIVERHVVVLGDFKRGPARTARGRRASRWKLEKHDRSTPRGRRLEAGDPPAAGYSVGGSGAHPARAPRVILQGFRLLGDTTIIDV
ncbi:MAG: DUF1707 domain-containing protein [Spirochaetaceae bacterium]